MLDEHVWGAARRISPEAPVPVVEVRDRTYAAGGAGNVASGIVALGGSSVPGWPSATTRPDRGSGRRLAVGDRSWRVGLNSERSTTITKTRVIVQGQQVVRVDRGMPGSTSSTELELAAIGSAERSAGERRCRGAFRLRERSDDREPGTPHHRCRAASGIPAIVDPESRGLHEIPRGDCADTEPAGRETGDRDRQPNLLWNSTS